MTREEMRTRAKQRRIKEVARNKMMILFMISFIVIAGIMIYSSIFASAYSEPEQTVAEYKYYKSIIIEDGDTLWSIASEFVDEHYEDTQDYIDEVISVNQLKSNKIYAGQHLVVAYYDTEYR